MVYSDRKIKLFSLNFETYRGGYNHLYYNALPFVFF